MNGKKIKMEINKKSNFNKMREMLDKFYDYIESGILTKPYIESKETESGTLKKTKIY
jgi:hypothetical protein